MGTKILSVSKLIWICFFLVVLIAGVFYFFNKNRINASTNHVIIPTQNLDNITTAETNAENDKIAISSVPILMYHHVRIYQNTEDKIGLNLSVSPDIFERQLRFLESNNYQSITFSQMIEGYKGNFKIAKDKKPIIITFDDGYDNAYTNAYPILKKHNFSAVFYIITAQIGQSERMTKNQIIDLDKNDMTIASHTKSHPDLNNLDSDSNTDQLINSKQTLESILGHAISNFCYPAGKYNDSVISILKTAGYITAVTTKYGISDTGSSLYELPRIRVQNSTNLEKVLNK